MEFQKNLKEEREKKGYKTAKEFSEAIRIPYSTYLSYENAGKEPKYETLIKIANKLGISTDELLGRVPPSAWGSLIDIKPVEGGYILTDWVGIESDNDKFISEKVMKEILQAGEKVKRQYISDCIRWYLHEHDEQQE